MASAGLTYALNNGSTEEQYYKQIFDAFAKAQSQGLSDAQIEIGMNQYGISASDLARATGVTPESVQTKMDVATPTTAADLAYERAAQAEYDATLPVVDPNATGGSGGASGGRFGLQFEAKGGLINPMKFAMGGFAKGTDTVPAMLTPGEFVMNKKATNAFGPQLAAMNSSRYPSMMAKGLAAPTYQNSLNKINAPSKVSNSTSVNNNSSAVYNYSVGINIGGSNANPQDIARAVMTQIKNVDSQRIRTQR
jgi:hypothetical protein